jgi:hypothetical protein
MNEKLKVWNASVSWEQAEKEWEEGASQAAASHPIKKLSVLPQMPGIAEKHLKIKSLFYLITHDSLRIFRRYVFKHPLKYAARWIASAVKKKSYRRDGDFFLYRIQDVAAFKQQLLAPDTLFVMGFSYCHKPFECPSGRFSDQCIHDPSHPVCRQCFIGKAMHALPEKKLCVPLFIPTVHYIGEKMFELSERYPDKKILFLITACEMTLEMFGDWGNMLGIRGIGVRLDGRICNTMKAFDLSERGIKPGLTVVLDSTQKRILDIIQFLHLSEGAPAEKV